MAQDFTLLGGSQRNIERRVFGHGLRVSVDDTADRTTQRLADAYNKAWGSVSSLAGRLAEDAATARHERALSPREVARLDRVDRALFALERQVRELGKFTGVTVTGGATSGIAKFASTVLDQIPDLAGVDRRFTKPSGAAMEGLVLRSTERIETATRALTVQQQISLKEGLLRGLVLGENPRTTARAIRGEIHDGFFMGLHRSETIARTEIADAHRYATRLAYTDSDLVVGWKWLASLGPRTCPACWAMHNTFHEKSELQYGHQNCRCTMVPVLVDDLPTDHDLGDPEELFWGLPREQQVAIMGPGRLKALEAGAPFSALAYLKHNPSWRPAHYATPVADLAGLADLHVASTLGDFIPIPGQDNRSILTAAYKQGGLTINTLSGEQPTTGFVVARNGTSRVIDAREFFGPAGPAQVSDWLIEQGDLLDEKGAHMGLWYDTANGKVVLDVVQILDDREQAIALGKAEDQIAIFDLGSFTEIPTGGTGGYAQGAPEALNAPLATGQRVSATAGPRSVTGKVTALDGDKVTIKGDDGFLYSVTTADITKTHGNAEEVARRQAALAEVAAQTTVPTIGESVGYDGLEPALAQTYDDELGHQSSVWDGERPERVTTDTLPTYRVAETRSRRWGKGFRSDIVFNAQSYATQARVADALRENEESGEYAKGVSAVGPKWIATHEFGHLLDHSLLGAPGSAARADLLVDVLDRLAAKHNVARGPIEALRTAPARLRYSTAVSALTKPDIVRLVRKDLSGYGASSVGEMIAEGFAAFTHFGPGRSAVADAVGRAYLTAYRRQHGHFPAGYSQTDLDRLEGK